MVPVGAVDIPTLKSFRDYYVTKQLVGDAVIFVFIRLGDISLTHSRDRLVTFIGNRRQMIIYLFYNTTEFFCTNCIHYGCRIS